MYKYLRIFNDIENMIQHGEIKEGKEITVYTIACYAI